METNDFQNWYKRLLNDYRIGPVHISLFLALYDEQQVSGQKAIVQISRNQIMQKARIAGRSTYNRYMHDLADFGYINYSPTKYKKHKSKVQLRIL